MLSLYTDRLRFCAAFSLLHLRDTLHGQFVTILSINKTTGTYPIFNM